VAPALLREEHEDAVAALQRGLQRARAVCASAAQLQQLARVCDSLAASRDATAAALMACKATTSA
jgi:hypothetical protein